MEKEIQKKVDSCKKQLNKRRYKNNQKVKTKQININSKLKISQHYKNTKRRKK